MYGNFAMMRAANDPKVLLGYVAEALDAVELFLSRHTIKLQANSIYRKLGASSRSQAVTRARELNPPGGVTIRALR